MSTSQLDKRVENHILGQFRDEKAQEELRFLGPNDFDWVQRTEQTLDALLPELPILAEKLVQVIPRRLNSALSLDALVQRGGNYIHKSPESKQWLDDLEKNASVARELIGHIESQQVSAEIQRFIGSKNGLGQLVYSNGNSIYPDLILYRHSYEGLPFQDRKAPIDGPCLRGEKEPRPSNVPDGCELKTNRGNKIRVDAHGAHPGLHVGVTWDFTDDGIKINGVWGGYIRIADHRESGRNVNATTVKYSFGHNLFVSLV